MEQMEEKENIKSQASASALTGKDGRKTVQAGPVLFLLRFFLCLLLVFAVGKVVFMLYNRSTEAFV